MATPVAAIAAPDKAPATAIERFKAAQALYDKGKYDEALVLFQAVYADSKSPNARLMAARSLLALGKTADAYDELYATMREAATRAEKEPKYGKTRDAAGAEISRLEEKIGKVIIASVDPAATVTVNGTTLTAARLGVPMAVLPGQLHVVATKPDGSTTTRDETIGAGDTKTITLVFEAPKAAPATPATATPTGATPADHSHDNVPAVKSGGGVRIAGVVVAILGAGGIGAFAGTFVVAQNKYNTLKTGCHMARCTDPQFDPVVDSGKQLELVSDVSLGVGAAALVTGTFMIALGGPKLKRTDSVERDGVSTRIAITPGGVALWGSF